MWQRQRLAWVIGVCLLAVLLSGCTVYLPIVEKAAGDVTEMGEMVERPLYVLSKSVSSPEGRIYNELVAVDAANWEVIRRTVLPDGYPWNIDQDPQGRIWVGYGTTPGKGESRVAVVSAEGELEQVIRPCGDPSYGIHFSDRYAFVPCRVNGFFGRVSVVDLQDLAVTQTIELQYEEKFGIVASGAGDEKVLVFGSGSTQNR
ncbi:hypothetical protein GC175_06540, partial [bacterium]|nr:hypothetical protein [bacterium]